MKTSGNRRQKALRLVGDPVLANALCTELLALADAHPELGEPGAALPRLAGRALGEQKKELEHLRGTIIPLRPLSRSTRETWAPL